MLKILQRCKEEDPTLVTQYKPKRLDREDRKHKKHREKERAHRHQSIIDWEAPVIKKSSKRCGQCTGCLRTDNCGKCDACRYKKIIFKLFTILHNIKLLILEFNISTS